MKKFIKNHPYLFCEVIGLLLFNFSTIDEPSSLKGILGILGVLIMLSSPIVIKICINLHPDYKKELENRKKEKNQKQKNNNSKVFINDNYKLIYSYFTNNFYINENEKKLCINNKIYDFKDILDYEIVNDESSITKKSLGSALGRSLLFGDIIGGLTAKNKSNKYCNDLRIKVTINDLSNPIVNISFVNGKISKNGFEFKNRLKKAEQICSILNIIINRNK